MYKHLFGPVPSRRLGMSLGVDLVPLKVCTLNCIYCQCGPTTQLTIERKEYVPFDEVISELKHYLANNPELDYITFSGSGEPTLNSRIGDVLKFIKQNYPNLSVAVLTNGTLLNDEKVREELLGADVVLPSLDAPSDSLFRKINRPFPALNLEKHIAGLRKFKKAFQGQMWLEIFIVPGYNDSKPALNLLKETCIKIQPNLLQLNTLDRPGAVPDLRAASREELEQIVSYWKLGNVEIIASAPIRKDSKSYRTDIETAILETLLRRPCTLEDLVKILGLHANEVNKYLDVLEADNKIKTTRQTRGVFYQIGQK